MRSYKILLTRPISVNRSATGLLQGWEGDEYVTKLEEVVLSRLVLFITTMSGTCKTTLRCYVVVKRTDIFCEELMFQIQHSIFRTEQVVMYLLFSISMIHQRTSEDSAVAGVLCG